MTQNTSASCPPAFITLAGFQAIPLVLGWALLALLSQPSLALGTLGMAAWSWGLIAAVITYALLAVLYRYSRTVQHSMFVTLGKMQSLFVRFSWGQLVLISVLAGVGEELLFRVFLQTFIAEYSHAWVGLGVASILFALLHFISWVYFVLTLVIGLLLGLGYHLSQSWVLVMVWHGVYDLIALGVLVYAPQVLGLPRPQASHTTAS